MYDSGQCRVVLYLKSVSMYKHSRRTCKRYFIGNCLEVFMSKFNKATMVEMLLSWETDISNISSICNLIYVEI